MRDFEELTQTRRSGRRRNWLGYLAIAFLAVVGIGVAASAAPFLEGEKVLSQRVSGESPRILEMLASPSDEPQNILVMGVDQRPEVEGSRADTMILARIYPGTGKVRLVSIPRDLLVEVSPGVEDKINAAYSYDGVSGTIGAVENFSNVYIDHYAVVDFEGFEAVVGALGGLKVDLEEGQVPPNWKVKDEAQHLNGRRALIYARYRNSSGGDLDRIRRQQEVLAALRSKALRWRSAEKYPEITRAVFENVETDMSLAEIAFLGRAMAEHGRNGLMTSTQLKGTPDTLENGSKVLVPDEAENEQILREFRN
ncbi:MAG TPA: LCP family protein [Rubrobacteraceae bacterium]|nr:LCP family protein [Rubrobacteraceae bacterium]